MNDEIYFIQLLKALHEVMLFNDGLAVKQYFSQIYLKLKNFDDVDRIQSVIGELNDDIANCDTNKANARKALQVAQGDLEKAKEVEVKTKEALEKATADFKAKSETVVQAQKAVDSYNTCVEAEKNAQTEMKIIGNQIDELKACKES